MRVAFLMLLVLVGCSTPTSPTVHGIANFAAVDADLGIYRGGQPAAAGWVYLNSIGVSNVVKLNLREEGADPPVDGTFTFVPISPAEQLLGVSRLKLDLAVAGIGPGTYIHCEHGQDRTGLIVACWRVNVQHWTKAAAEQEMLAHGFHKSLLGLWEFWKGFASRSLSRLTAAVNRIRSRCRCGAGVNSSQAV